VKRDIDFIKERELAIAAIFVLPDIACMDENTHQKLFNMCINNERYIKKCCNHVHLQNSVKSELAKMLKNDR
jgi:hypothetical protein